MQKKYFIRTALIISLIFAVLIAFYCISFYFLHPSGSNYVRVEGFKKEEENSIDVALIGASDVFTGFSSGLAYEKFGITSFPYAVDSADINIWQSMCDNILEKQKPKVLIVELHSGFGALMDNIDESVMRYLYSGAKFSQNLKQRMDYANVGQEYDLLSYLVPGIYFHGFTSFIKSNFFESLLLQKIRFLPLKGNLTMAGIYTPKDPETDFSNAKPRPIDQNTEKYLKDFLEYCKKVGFKNVLFINFPDISEKDNPKYNVQMADYVGNIVTEYGYDFLNGEYLLGEIGIDNARDFHDAWHMNIYGQAKFTKYLTNYIKEKYHLKPTELSEKSQKNWDYSVKAYHIFYDYVDALIKQKKDETVYDSPEFIEYLTQQLGEEGLMK